MKRNEKASGIQKKYLKYTAALLGLALLLSSLGAGLYVKNRLTRAVIAKYEFMTERMGISLENLFLSLIPELRLCYRNNCTQ